MAKRVCPNKAKSTGKPCERPEGHTGPHRSGLGTYQSPTFRDPTGLPIDLLFGAALGAFARLGATGVMILKNGSEISEIPLTSEDLAALGTHRLMSYANALVSALPATEIARPMRAKKRDRKK